MVGAGLAGRIRAVRRERRFFGEGGVVLAERAVNLIVGNVQEAEHGLVGIAHPIPVTAHFFQQMEGADDVGLDEVFRAVDGAIDMRFGSEIDDRARLLFSQLFGDQSTFADVALDEDVVTVSVVGFAALRSQPSQFTKTPSCASSAAHHPAAKR